MIAAGLQGVLEVEWLGDYTDGENAKAHVRSWQ